MSLIKTVSLEQMQDCYHNPICKETDCAQQEYTYSGLDLLEGWDSCAVMCSLFFSPSSSTVLENYMFPLEPVAGLRFSIAGVLCFTEGLKGRCDAVHNWGARNHLSPALCCHLWTPWWLSPFLTCIMIATYAFLMLKRHILCNGYSHHNCLRKQKQLHAWTI